MLKRPLARAFAAAGLLLALPALPGFMGETAATTVAAQGGDIADQTLRYAVSYRGLNAGTVEINLRAEGHGYVVTSTGKPSMLAAMFFKAHTSETRFGWLARGDGEGNVLALDSGNEQLAGSSGYRRGFRFNRALGRIEFSDGKHRAIQPGDRFEAAAFPLLLMLRPPGEIAGSQVREVSARRVREYRYEEPVAERVEVPAGAFAGWKITRHRIDRPSERVIVWLRKSGETGSSIPLKIAIHKKGATRMLKLLAPPAPGKPAESTESTESTER